MDKVKQISFQGQRFFIGIDVHLKSWKVTIRHNNMRLKKFSMNPSPEELYRHMQRKLYHLELEQCSFI
jgi:hypothetical protein